MPGKLDTTEKVIKIIALVLAGIWAIWGFVYQDRILPSRAPTNLTISTDLEVVGDFDRFKAVKTTVRAKNTGNVRAYIIGSLFNVRGYRLHIKKEAAAPTENLVLLRDGVGDLIDLPQWVWRDKGRILNSGRLFPAFGAWLDPDEERTADFLTFVPREYELLSVRSEIRHSKTRDSEKVRIENIIAPDGFIGFHTTVLDGDKKEAYNFDKHSPILKDANPDRVYSVAYLLISEGKDAAATGIAMGTGSHNQSLNRTDTAPTRGPAG